MAVHLIPCLVYIRDAETREEAFNRVKDSIVFRWKKGTEPPSVEFPNDEPDGVWHLKFAPGPPSEDLDEFIEWDPTSDRLVGKRPVGAHEEESE